MTDEDGNVIDEWVSTEKAHDQRADSWKILYDDRNKTTDGYVT